MVVVMKMSKNEVMNIDMDTTLPQEINMLLHFKAFEFKRSGIEHITAQDLRGYLHDFLWRDEDKLPLCQVVDDIMSLKFGDVYDYMQSVAITQAHYKQLSDFEELIRK